MSRTERLRNSPVEWIGATPSNWAVRDLIWCCSENKTKNTGGIESQVLSLSYGNIVPRDVESNMGLLPESFETYQVVASGDVVLRLTDLQNDKRSLRVGLVRQKGIITSAYVCLKPGVDVLPKFLSALLHSYDVAKVFYSFGGGVRQSMRYEDLKHLPILVPPIPTQQAIANYLDEKTAAIDALIEKKRKLLDLLAEERAALINQAVTKGLDPTVPMKDSGIPWIGEIPAHWGVAPVRRLFEPLDHMRVPVSAEERSERQGEIPYYGASGIIDYVDDYLFDEPLILVCEDGWNLMLRSQPVARGISGRTWVNNHAHILRPKQGPVEFWATALEITPYETFVTGMRQPKLTGDALKTIALAYPPSEAEMNKVAQAIIQADAHIGSVTDRISNQTKRLQEYRQALITAAVTGQLDIEAAA